MATAGSEWTAMLVKLPDQTWLPEPAALVWAVEGRWVVLAVDLILEKSAVTLERKAAFLRTKTLE